jgi:nitric-oxide synthase
VDSRSTTPADKLAAAAAFLEMYYAENRDAQTSLARRRVEVWSELERTGTYTHTHAELVFGARVAWRQSTRCVGRARWASLVVRDARRVDQPHRVAWQLARHLRYATHSGRIRSTMTVFAPDDAAGPRARIWNDQLVRYAGWRRADGGVVGDPRQVGLTQLALDLGWTPPARPTRWDVLPWIVETRRGGPRVFDVPRRAVLEVPIRHPEVRALDDLGLRWYAVPAVSNMRLHIGGIDYSAAPFNGFYLGDEIGSRNLADVDRYDQLPEVAAGLGLDTSSDRTLWRDRALVELNRAVLHSFDTARVSIADHHAEAAHFMRFAAREEAAGRCPFADWTWINSHISPPATPTFHRLWRNEEHQPNFWLDEGAKGRAQGERVGPALAELGPADGRYRSLPLTHTS